MGYIVHFADPWDYHCETVYGLHEGAAEKMFENKLYIIKLFRETICT